MKKLLLLLSFATYVGDIYAQDAIPSKGDELFSSIRARHIGPALMSGRISDLEGHPTDPKIMYVGSAGGGVWKSSDGGVSYNAVFDKHNQSIGAIAVDPKNPDQVIWVGTGECWTRNSVSVGDGIYKSTDGGQNWVNMGLTDSERISNIVIDPTNSDVIYVSVLGHLWGNSPERGVYKTTDGGKTWNKIFYVNETTGCADLIIDPKNPNVLFASFWEFRRTAYSFNSGGENSALYKTIDGGKNWSKIQNNFPSGKMGRIAVAMAPSDSKIIYAAVETEKNEDKGLYKSTDGGNNWKKTNSDFELVVRPFYFSRLVIDPKNPDIVCKASYNGAISKDGGQTFRNISNGSPHSDFHDYWFDIKDSNHITCATDGGVYRSYDGGNTWDMVRCLPVSQYYHVSVDNQTPYKIYGGLQDNGSWVGPSSNPGGIENRNWVNVGQGDGFRVFPYLPNPNIVYSEAQGAEAVWRYDIEHKEITSIAPFANATDTKLRFNWNAAMVTSPKNPKRLYMGSQFLHKSEDQGNTWQKISPDLTTNDKTKLQQDKSGGASTDNSGAENHCTIFAINESPLDENIIWVGTDDGNVQITLDGGKTWSNLVSNISDLPKNTWAYYIEPSIYDKNTAYAVFDGHTQNDLKTYVYKTTDLGKTWKSLVTADIKGFARCIKEDPKNPNVLFLGTEFGLFITLDNGQNWAQFKNNMPPVPVHSIAIQTREDALVMGTHGRGIIIIDDISPLRQVNKDILSKELVFLKSKPFVLKASNGFDGYATFGEFVGDNPTKNAQFAYYMKSRHTFGKMTMEIDDEKGHKVVDLTPSKSKGLNIVNWDYRIKIPKVAKAKTFSPSGTGPTVLPGNYKVKIIKGSNVYESNFTVQRDTTSNYSEKQILEKYNTSMKLYAMNEDLAYVVDELDIMKNGSEVALKGIDTDKKLKKQLLPVNTFLGKIDELRQTLIVLKGDNYTDTAEPQLREKIGRLYSEVIMNTGIPTNGQLDNLKLLDEKLSEAKKKTDALVNELPAINQKLQAAKMPEIKIRSKDEFMKADL